MTCFFSISSINQYETPAYKVVCGSALIFFISSVAFIAIASHSTAFTALGGMPFLWTAIILEGVLLVVFVGGSARLLCRESILKRHVEIEQSTEEETDEEISMVPEEESPLARLPDEVWLHVFSHFTSLEDLASCSAVSSKWRGFAQEGWKHLLRQEYGQATFEEMELLVEQQLLSWSEAYRFAPLAPFLNALVANGERVEVKINGSRIIYYDVPQSCVQHGQYQFTIQQTTVGMRKRGSLQEEMLPYEADEHSSLILDDFNVGNLITHLAAEGNFLFAMRYDGYILQWNYRTKKLIQIIPSAVATIGGESTLYDPEGTLLKENKLKKRIKCFLVQDGKVFIRYANKLCSSHKPESNPHRNFFECFSYQNATQRILVDHYFSQKELTIHGQMVYYFNWHQIDRFKICDHEIKRVTPNLFVMKGIGCLFLDGSEGYAVNVINEVVYFSHFDLDAFDLNARSAPVVHFSSIPHRINPTKLTIFEGYFIVFDDMKRVTFFDRETGKYIRSINIYNNHYELHPQALSTFFNVLRTKESNKICAVM